LPEFGALLKAPHPRKRAVEDDAIAIRQRPTTFDRNVLLGQHRELTTWQAILAVDFRPQGLGNATAPAAFTTRSSSILNPNWADILVQEN
jgi:hypothetical protein